MPDEKKILTYAFFLIVAFIVLYRLFHTVEIDADTWAHLSDERSSSVAQQQGRQFLSLTLFQQIGLLMVFMLIPVGLMIMKNKSVAHQLSSRIKRHENLTTRHEEAPKGFSDKLLAAYPHLTPYDLTLCEMIMEKRSSKQIATSLNISAASVNTARYRLRKKLGIPQGQELMLFLQQFKA